MSEKDITCSNEAVEKIIGNITSEMQNVDGQYIPLGFSTTPSEPPNWSTQPNPYLSPFNQDLSYNAAALDPHQFAQSSFNYINQQPLFNSSIYNKIKINDLYQNQDVYNMEYMAPPPRPSHSEPPTSQIIENLVGNWVPNTSGTYSPFGNVEPFKPTFDQQLDDEKFHFKTVTTTTTTVTKKPRIVAEVKPMRPSYSDVLTKPVPQQPNKTAKIEPKEIKPKKENKKNNKIDKDNKEKKMILNRFNTTSDINNVPLDKNQFRTNDKEKTTQKTQLNRKWASLDNINSEPLNHTAVKNEEKKRKSDDIKTPKTVKKVNKSSDTNDDVFGTKPETISAPKNNVTKKNNNNKANGRQKNNEPVERPSAKRNQRARKRENNVAFGLVRQKLKQYLKGWWKYLAAFLLWLFHLISDVCSLSLHIGRDLAFNFWSWSCIHWYLFLETSLTVIKRIRFLSWIWEKFKKKEKPPPVPKTENKFVHNGLQNNINMPTTGEEAMKRLLACKDKDPYSILGVTPTCTDEDIKRYYKRQAFLVHPDKNQQPGAEEAFKILVHAFDMIGEPERRGDYDKGVVESVQVEQAWSELTELLAQLQRKMEAAANTIRCSACGSRHKRTKIDRPVYAARNCTTCKIHHAAREGDIWAEATCMGFLWHYYACMEGGIYDITEWAGCQKDSLKHLKSDSHQVQYRIALGKNNANNNNNGHQQQSSRRHSGSPRASERPPDLENLLNTLYGQTDTATGAGGSNNAKRRTKKAK